MEEQEYKPGIFTRVRVWTTRKLIQLAGLTAACAIVYYTSPTARSWVGDAHAYLEPQIKIVTKYVEAPRKSLDQAVREKAAKYSVPELLIHAIIRQESPSGRPDHVRYEPHHAKRYSTQSWMINDSERRMLASSIGYMQVMYGLHAANEKGVCSDIVESWSDLVDVETNIECGVRVLVQCLQYNQKLQHNKPRWYRAALGCYNGDREVYPSRVLNHLADIVLEGL